MPVHQSRNSKKNIEETYHSDKLVWGSAGGEQKPVAVIVGGGGIAVLEITDRVEMEYPVDICNI